MYNNSNPGNVGTRLPPEYMPDIAVHLLGQKTVSNMFDPYEAKATSLTGRPISRCRQNCSEQSLKYWTAMTYNRLRTMRDNIEAIRLVLRLGEIGRTAQSAEERDILRKYAGFGGLNVS